MLFESEPNQNSVYVIDNKKHFGSTEGFNRYRSTPLKRSLFVLISQRFRRLLKRGSNSISFHIRGSLAKAADVIRALIPAYWLFFPVFAFAKPTPLECTLASAGADTKETTRKISIVFDSEANTLDVYQGSQLIKLAKVSISTISIDGYTDDMSIGIDRSSWSIVVQTYSQDHTLAEFGVCKPHP